MFVLDANLLSRLYSTDLLWNSSPLCVLGIFWNLQFVASSDCVLVVFYTATMHINRHPKLASQDQLDLLHLDLDGTLR